MGRGWGVIPCPLVSHVHGPGAGHPFSLCTDDRPVDPSGLAAHIDFLSVHSPRVTASLVCFEPNIVSVFLPKSQPPCTLAPISHTEVFNAIPMEFKKLWDYQLYFQEGFYTLGTLASAELDMRQTLGICLKLSLPIEQS